ncbi:hypothetical protein [Azospirillum soli]|uniref:hypothetical protein n=1 Tax=Azospirillum soli TaxID=1304799 RepID=UPI001FEB24BE|nr:hypothetical protein [Azospirillum soli]MBP2311327.1 hypothetical protein [Azospirillum soli]
MWFKSLLGGRRRGVRPAAVAPTPVSLFEAVWLTAPADDDILARIDAVERRADEALARFRDEAARQTIDALLALETRDIPRSAAAADQAVERFMLDVGFRKRDLMPRFHELADHVRRVHRDALVICRDRRWELMVERALSDPGGPSSPIHGNGTRYVKSDRYDDRAARNLPPDDRVRADRALKRLGEDPTPPELDLCPMEEQRGLLWTMKAGGANRFILRRGEHRETPCFFVEDVGPYPNYDGWAARR